MLYVRVGIFLRRLGPIKCLISALFCWNVCTKPGAWTFSYMYLGVSLLPLFYDFPIGFWLINWCLTPTLAIFQLHRSVIGFWDCTDGVVFFHNLIVIRLIDWLIGVYRECNKHTDQLISVNTLDLAHKNNIILCNQVRTNGFILLICLLYVQITWLFYTKVFYS
jgi:hypothetical protein